MTAGRMIPPKAAMTGRAPDRNVARWPTVNSRLISSPTTKKNTVSSPWLTQCNRECVNACAPQSTPIGLSQKAANAAANGELLRVIAIKVAKPSNTPDDGPQRTNLNAAAWMRWPSGASMASASELSSHVPV